MSILLSAFFPEAYKKDLGILGSKSGRDGDKISLTSLTPQPVEHGVTFLASISHANL